MLIKQLWSFRFHSPINSLPGSIAHHTWQIYRLSYEPFRIFLSVPEDKNGNMQTQKLCHTKNMLNWTTKLTKSVKATFLKDKKLIFNVHCCRKQFDFSEFYVALFTLRFRVIVSVLSLPFSASRSMLSDLHLNEIAIHHWHTLHIKVLNGIPWSINILNYGSLQLKSIHSSSSSVQANQLIEREEIFNRILSILALLLVKQVNVFHSNWWAETISYSWIETMTLIQFYLLNEWKFEHILFTISHEMVQHFHKSCLFGFLVSKNNSSQNQS